jgi:hypothetical protein
MEVLMVALITDSGPFPQLDFEIDRLRRLRDDLENIRHGRQPGRKALETAPKIEDSNVINRPIPCLTGRVYGHPRIKEGGIGITTDLWVIAPELGYARTLSRFYILGMPGTQ